MNFDVALKTLEVLDYIPVEPNASVNCIRLHFFERIHLLQLHYFLCSIWKRPSKPPTSAGKDDRTIALESVVAFFSVRLSEQERFVLPDPVIAKLEEYSFCLFGKP